MVLLDIAFTLAALALLAPALVLLAECGLAALPDAAVVRIYEPPTMVPALAERSPAATLLGTLNVRFVNGF